MGAILSSSQNSTPEQIDVETLLTKLESSIEFESLISLLRSFKASSASKLDFSADRLFRAVSTQLDRFWLPEQQNVTTTHQNKQSALDALCWLIGNFIAESPGDVLTMLESETLEKLLRALIPFLVLHFDDSSDENNWTPKCKVLKLLLWGLFDYNDETDRYKHNQTKLLTTIIGLMTKVSKTPASEFNFFSQSYPICAGLKDSFTSILAYMLGQCEWGPSSIKNHIEYDQILFACYRFMQAYEGDHMWSLNMEAFGRVVSLVGFIVRSLSTDEILQHFTLILNDLVEKDLKPSSVVLIKFLKTLKVPVENIQLDVKEEKGTSLEVGGEEKLETENPEPANENPEKLSSTPQLIQQSNSTSPSYFGFW